MAAMSVEDHKQALPAGYRLGSYRVVRVLGAGGLGVTYLCEHGGLGVQVAVKEYLPNEIAVRDGTEVHPKSAGDREGFEWGLRRFLDEARTLARFEHPNVVRVRDCFEANNTAYIVMDYEDGEPLDALLERHGTLTEAQLKRVVLPVADGLRQMHAAGFLHRDIKPANIFVRRSDESPVLLDFGSARQALGRSRARSMTAIASTGYSPPEQYESDGAQGAWTDIYALSALCHRAITGRVPVDAPRRTSELVRSRADPQASLAASGATGYSSGFLEAVDWGLRVIETERPHSLEDWLARLEEPKEAHETAPRYNNTIVPIPWGEFLKSFFETFGCCMWDMWDQPELRWYQESWGALMRAECTGLNPVNCEDVETPSKLQAICLLHMYLGIYQQGCASLKGYCFGPDHLSEMVDALEVDQPELLRALDAVGLFDVDYARGMLRWLVGHNDLIDVLVEGRSWCETSELLVREIGVDFADIIAVSFLDLHGWDVVSDLVRTDNQLIYSVICEHYGGEHELALSILNSRRELKHVGGVEETDTDDQIKIFSYVKDGMEGWIANTRQ